MDIISGTLQFDTGTATAVTLGKFDGLHTGHQKLIGAVCAKAAEGLKPTVVAFDFGRMGMLTPGEERRALLESFGVELLVECPFTEQLSYMEPEQFVRQILCDQLHAAYLAVGSDFRFGYQRKGDYRLLLEMASECGFKVDVIDKKMCGDREISSTYVREALEVGNMELVSELLGYPYTVRGKIIHGRAVGRTIGLPTINQLPSSFKMLPPKGVYVSRVLIEDKEYFGITNIGTKPTVGDKNQMGVETYIFDVDENLYEKDAHVSLLSFERPERRFADLDELKNQIEADIRWGRAYIKEHVKGE